MNEELRGAQEQANSEKHKCMELQGKHFQCQEDTVLSPNAHAHLSQMHEINTNFFIGILEEERKEKKLQADESAKQIHLLQGICVLLKLYCLIQVKKSTVVIL